MALLKQPRQEDSDYLDFIRDKNCLVANKSCIGEIAPHHTISRGAWGSDHRAIPLCAFHHLEIEQRGINFMQETYHFSILDEIIKLLSEYLEKKEIAR